MLSLCYEKQSTWASEEMVHLELFHLDGVGMDPQNLKHLTCFLQIDQDPGGGGGDQRKRTLQTPSKKDLVWTDRSHDEKSDVLHHSLDTYQPIGLFSICSQTTCSCEISAWHARVDRGIHQDFTTLLAMKPDCIFSTRISVSISQRGSYI